MKRKVLSFILFAFVACGDDATSIDAGDDGGVDAFVSDASADAGSDAPASSPEVETMNGPVVGNRGGGFVEFMGIPYAAAPIGDRRWRAPEPHPGWSEPLDATGLPTRCRQSALGIDVGGDEDCLFLSVHAPDPMPSDAPVMVWFHGGAFIFGEGIQLDQGTRGDVLAQRGVVVVSMNYRLGPYGFLAHPDLTAESGTSGNFGFQDQIAALEWVRDNIAAFGGDPENVTVFGESAGGYSVCLHLIAPESEGLFDKAIIESGLCDRGIETLAEAETFGDSFASGLGCEGGDAVACLRALPAETIDASDPGAQIFETLSGGRAWWPVVDGNVVPGDFRTQVEAGDFVAVPTIAGWNADEGTLFVMLAEQGMERTMNEADYDETLEGLETAFGVSVDAIRAQYPLADFPDPGAAIAAALGHASLACPTRRTAELLAERTETWVYNFTYPDPGFQLPEDRELGAFHSAEIQYVFGHPTSVGQRIFRGDDLLLHEVMADLWVRFARTGDPNGGAVSWPAFGVSDEHLELDRETRASAGADAEVCALWNPSTT